MTGLIILTFIPAFAAVMFWLRARREMQARQTAEARIADLEAERAAPRADVDNAPLTPAAQRAARGQVLGVVSHELRSPISAILGYQELLAEGIFGPLEPRAADAMTRIRHSAVQLLNLTDGMVELARGPAPADDLEIDTVDIAALAEQCLQHAISEGAGRSVNVSADIAADLPPVQTDPDRLRRIVDLLVAAAIKVSPNGDLTLQAKRTEHGTVIAVTGARLDPERDVPAQNGVPFQTGAALRIAMAQTGALSLGATVEVDAATGRLAVLLID